MDYHPSMPELQINNSDHSLRDICSQFLHRIRYRTVEITAPRLSPRRENYKSGPTIIRSPLLPRTLNLEIQIDLRPPHIRIIQWRFQYADIIREGGGIIDIRDRNIASRVRNRYRFSFVHVLKLHCSYDVYVLSFWLRNIVDCDVPEHAAAFASETDATGSCGGSRLVLGILGRLADADICKCNWEECGKLHGSDIEEI